MKILIGSCGGLTGVYLSRNLKRLLGIPNITLLGFDSNSEVVTRFFLDDFFIIPPATEENLFVQDLVKLLNDAKPDVYIPVHSNEVRVISKYAQVLRSQTPTQFLISPYGTYEVLDDKLKAYEELNEMGISTPKYFISASNITNFPVLAKPRRSSGSKGITFCNNRRLAEALEESWNDLVFVELIQGREITVDAFFDAQGRLVTYNQRERLKVLGGAAIVTRNDFSNDVKDYLVKIASRLKIIGPANFQFFIDNEGRTLFTDVNLRFASGGLPLSVESGVNLVKLYVLEALGQPYNPSEFQSDRKKRTMYRYFEELYEIEENNNF